MSFSEDPYKHVSVVHREGVFGWECNGCGADSFRDASYRKAETFGSTDTIAEVADAFWTHIRNSHRRTPDDFKGWS